MTHGDYVKQRDHILESVQNYIDDDDAKREGRILAAQAIDALVLQVIGDNEPYLRGRQFYASPKAFKNAAIKIENELRTEQRKTVQGDKS